MPIYEYVCKECKSIFDALRPFDDADSPIACTACGSDHTTRKISLFYAQSDGRSVTGSSSGCSTCSSSSCSSCSVRH